MQAWHTESNFLILLAAEDEDALLWYADAAVNKSIDYVLINEPDWPGAPATALVLAPSAAATKLCANLGLALKEYAMVS